MAALPQIRIHGRHFWLDQRLREIRAVQNPVEIYLLVQDIIPAKDAPAFHLPERGRSGNNGLTAHINSLPESDKDVEPVQYVPVEEEPRGRK